MSIEDCARRMLGTIEAARLAARNAGDPRAGEIGADGEALAKHALEPSGDAGELATVREQLSVALCELKMIGSFVASAQRRIARRGDATKELADTREPLPDAFEADAASGPQCDRCGDTGEAPDSTASDGRDAEQFAQGFVASAQDAALGSDKPPPMEPLAYVPPTPGWTGQAPVIAIENWEPPAELLIYFCRNVEPAETMATFIDRVRAYHCARVGRTGTYLYLCEDFKTWLDGVRAAERTSALVDPAQPKQLVVPGSIETPPVTSGAEPWKGGAAGKRGPEETPIEAWEPTEAQLQARVTALEDVEKVKAHLAAWRAENKGAIGKRWDLSFKAYLNKVRGVTAPGAIVTA